MRLAILAQHVRLQASWLADALALQDRELEFKPTLVTLLTLPFSLFSNAASYSFSTWLAKADWVLVA